MNTTKRVPKRVPSRLLRLSGMRLSPGTGTDGSRTAIRSLSWTVIAKEVLRVVIQRKATHHAKLIFLLSLDAPSILPLQLLFFLVGRIWPSGAIKWIGLEVTRRSVRVVCCSERSDRVQDVVGKTRSGSAPPLIIAHRRRCQATPPSPQHDRLSGRRQVQAR